MFNFHHVALSVMSIEKSAEFYAALGFEKVYEWQADDNSLRIAHLKLGGAFLELFCYPRPLEAPATTRELATDLPRIGIKHLGISVPSIADAKVALMAKGLVEQVSITKGRTGIDYFFVRDPDGIFVEIVQDDRGL